jgi:DNA-binding HxlR family transcriptional regulator
MTRTSLADMNCSFARAAERIGDKWSLLIIRDAFYGIYSFAEFKRRLGLAPTVLTDRLEKLCANGILERYQRREGVDRHAYRLTEAGQALFPIVVAVMQWGDAWISGEGKEPVQLFDKEALKPLPKLQVTDASGAPLNAADVTFDIGPGADARTRAEFARAAKMTKAARHA